MIQVRRCGYALGAEITGVDASAPLDEATVDAIRQAWLDHVIVYLPRQEITPEQFRSFCASFGELDIENVRLLPHHPDMPEMVIRSNTPVTINGAVAKKSPPANAWHSDFSTSEQPSSITFLHGSALPSIGGDTMFASMYAAYEALSPRMQSIVESLEGVHDVSLGKTYGARSTEEQNARLKTKPPVAHPVVKVHPESGRKGLFIAPRIRNFVGMTEEETKPLLDFLLDHSVRYEFVYRHRWSKNDLLMWDNRSSLHYAVQDYDAEPRTLLRCSLVGNKTGRVLAAT